MRKPIPVAQLVQDLRLLSLSDLRSRLEALALYDKTIYRAVCELFRPVRKRKITNQ